MQTPQSTGETYTARILVVAVLLIILLVVSLHVPNKFFRYTYPGIWTHPPYDFTVFRTASRALFSGENIYSVADGKYIYLPVLAFLLYPVALFSLHVSSILWLIIMHACLLFVVFTIWFIYRGTLKWWIILPVNLCLILVYVPLHREFINGQINLVLVALMCGAILAYARNWRILAGILVGLGGALKIVPFIFIFFFTAKKQWKPVVAAVITFLLLLVLPVIFAGANNYFSMLNQWKSTMVTPSTGTGQQKIGGFIHVQEEGNQSLLGSASRFLSIASTGSNDYPYVNYAEWEYGTVRYTVWGMGLILLGMTIFLIYSDTASTQEDFLHFVSFMPLVLVLSPVSWVTHYVFLFPVLAILLLELMKRRSKTSWVYIIFVFAALLIICPKLVFPAHVLSRLLALSSRFLGCMVLWSLILHVSMKKTVTGNISAIIAVICVAVTGFILIVPRVFPQYITFSQANQATQQHPAKKTGAATLLRPADGERMIGAYQNGVVRILHYVKEKDLQPWNVDTGEIDFTGSQGKQYLFRGFGEYTYYLGYALQTSEQVILFKTERHTISPQVRFAYFNLNPNLPRITNMKIEKVFLDDRVLATKITLGPEPKDTSSYPKSVPTAEWAKYFHKEYKLSLNEIKLNPDLDLHTLRIQLKDDYHSFYIKSVGFWEKTDVSRN